MKDKTIKSDTETLQTASTGRRDSMSMHANVEVWCDCCSCEAEPYWVEAMVEDDPTGTDKRR